jgi:hypothetical protein
MICVAFVALGACTNTDSATNLNPDGPPMIEQVRLTEIYDQMGTKLSRPVFAFGTHPQALDSDYPASGVVTSAKAINQKLLIIIDEILVGNYLEEVACRGMVDDDSYDSVPVGSTPDDIAKCSGSKDALAAACVGDHAVCVGPQDPPNTPCMADAGCIAHRCKGANVATGTMGVCAYQPLGIKDDNADGAADDTRFKPGAVGIKCGTVDVPIDLDKSYWNPSGDQQVPATGGFDALGPKIVLTPTGIDLTPGTPSYAMPTGLTCGLTFSPDIVDKQDIQVCAPESGSIKNPCTPGDVSLFQFTMEPLTVILQGINDNDTGVQRGDIVAQPNVPVLAGTLGAITMTENGAAFTKFSVSLPQPTTIAINVTTCPTCVATGLAAMTDYTITFPRAVTDLYSQGLPAPQVFHFQTGM